MIPPDNTETKFAEESCFSDLSPEKNTPLRFAEIPKFTVKTSQRSQTFLIKLYQVFNLMSIYRTMHIYNEYLVSVYFYLS